MEVLPYLDSVLISLSLFLMLGYHANLWHSFKTRPLHTSIGIDALRRKFWFQGIKEGDDKKGMLAVQSLRNTLMATILTAQIAILITLAMGALMNNAYKGSHIFNSAIFGSQSGRIFALKYGSASIFLLVSFFCSSVALGFLTDANFMVNACGDDQFSYRAHTQSIFERGFTLALIGNRSLCMSFPMLLWMFGPLPVALASVALVWGLYELDFAGKSTRSESNLVSVGN
ncbi:hypothetical protein AB3S75_030565 [Citrus x aurantiifolia]